MFVPVTMATLPKEEEAEVVECERAMRVARSNFNSRPLLVIPLVPVEVEVEVEVEALVVEEAMIDAQ